MEPNSFGKKLGIGVRVAGRIARDRAQEAKRQAAQQVPSDPTPNRAGAARAEVIPPPTRESVRARAEVLSQQSRMLGQGIGRGSRNFGQSFFRPFAHAGNVLWLEITGCFFALFAAFFGQNAWRLRTQYIAGPAHHTFELYCFLTVLFVYFSASSFLRARARSRRKASGT